MYVHMSCLEVVTGTAWRLWHVGMCAVSDGGGLGSGIRGEVEGWVG